VADDGVQFPATAEAGRSSSATGRAVLAEAVRSVDPALAARIGAAGHWRRDYLAAVRDVTTAGGRSAAAALAIAGAGVAALRARLVLRREGGEQPLAAGLPDAPAPATVAVRGRGARERELAVPYRGRELRGDALRAQLEAWVRGGVMEASCGAALDAVCAHPDWLALEGRRVALLGAGAEMGPVAPLANWGAEVLAVDVPRPAIWRRILAAARAGAGTVHVPLAADGLAAADDAELAERAGADLLAELPEVHAWVAREGADRPLVVAVHAYAPGAAHVRVAAAADAVAAELTAAREDVALAHLATPTDAYLVPQEVVEDRRRRWERRGRRAALQAPLRALARGRLYAPAPGELVAGEDGRTWGLADVLVPQQGPNYALAKRLQRWRSTLARADGRTVSCNVAPATRTRSVTSNRVLAAAYAGAHHFGVEVFEPATTRVLMAALLVHDLHRPLADPHPDGLFCAGAAHGGLWRAAYDPRSVLPLAAAAGLPAALRR
jgi:hypothetical protein